MATSNLVAPHPADAATAQTVPADLVLLVFIHGCVCQILGRICIKWRCSFKGNDSTFGDFPQRLQHILTESLPNTTIESVVFPVYEVSSDLLCS